MPLRVRWEMIFNQIIGDILTDMMVAGTIIEYYWWYRDKYSIPVRRRPYITQKSKIYLSINLC